LEENIKKEETSNKRIETDVRRLEERELTRKRLRIVETLHSHGQYKHYYTIHRDKTAEQKARSDELDKADGANAPLRDLQEKYQKEVNGFKKEGEEYRKSIDACKRAIDSQNSALEDDQNVLFELKRELGTLQAKQQARHSSLAKYKATLTQKLDAVRQLETQRVEWGVPNDGQAPSGRYKELLDAQEAMDARFQAALAHEGEMETQMEEAGRLTNRIITRLRSLQDDKNKSRDVKNERLTKIGKHKKEYVEAYHWYLANKHLFTQPILGPLILDINVTDPAYADVVEASIPAAIMYSFIAQNQSDFEVFSAEMLKKRNLKTNIFHDEPDEQFGVPALSREQLAELGFDGYVTDYIDAPETHLRLLRKKGVHYTAVGTRPLPDLNRVERIHEKLGLREPPIRSFISATSRYHIHYHALSGTVNTTEASFWTSQFLKDGVDETRQQEVEMRIQQTEQEVRMSEKLFNDTRPRLVEARKVKQDIEAQQKKLEEQRKVMLRVIGDIRKEEGHIKRAREGVESLQAAVDNEGTEGTTLKRRLATVALQRLERVATMTAKAREVQAFLTKKSLALLKEAQAAHYCRQVEDERQRSSEHIRALKDIVAQLKEELSQSKQMAQQAHRVFQEQQSILSEEELATYHSLAADFDVGAIAQERAQLAAEIVGAEHLNEGLVAEYHRREEQIARLKLEMDTKRVELTRMRSQIDDTKREWYGKVKNMVEKINDAAQQHFQRMGIAGEVRLHEEADYDKWAIHILVKFRNNEDLHLLDAQRQSGGVRIKKPR
jgi:chromosome segregation ATPase